MAQFSANAPHQARMVELIKQLAPTEGYTRSMLDNVTLMRSNRPLETTPALYEPSIVIVVQGRKRGFYGGEVYVYDAQHYLVLAIPLPFKTETVASEAEPMLGLAVRIDPGMTAALAMELDDATVLQEQKPASLYASFLEPKLADACLRLLEALSSPEECKVLGPAIVREITYRVLTGEQGVGLRAALRQEGHFARIVKVLRRIHSDYASSLDVAALAEEANMSVPAFHVHFKQVTLTSPIQYIKAIRLHQARLMMMRSGVTAAAAADLVGYESPSQFSREFKRMFGRTPIEEIRQLKSLFALAEPVRDFKSRTMHVGS